MASDSWNYVREMRNYTMEIKIVTKQITYFSGVTQSEILQNRLGKWERNGLAQKLQVARNSTFSFTTEKRVIKRLIWSQGKLTKTIAPSNVNQVICKIKNQSTKQLFL